LAKGQWVRLPPVRRLRRVSAVQARIADPDNSTFHVV
jgi:hypothetical protein